MEFKSVSDEYLRYHRFIYSVAIKIARSEDNRNEFEKVLLKKMTIYKIYKAGKTDNEDSEMNKRKLLELATIHNFLNLKSSFYSEFLSIIVEIICCSKTKIKESTFSEKIEIIKNMLSFAR